MFKSTFILLTILFLSVLGVFGYKNVEAVKIILFGYEVQVNLFLFMILNFVFIKLILNIYLVLSFVHSKLFCRKSK